MHRSSSSGRLLLFNTPSRMSACGVAMSQPAHLSLSLTTSPTSLLDLNEVSHKADDQPIPQLSRPLQTLSIREFEEFGLGLIEEFMGLRPQCDKVTVVLYLTSCPSLVHRVIDGVGANVTRLGLGWWPTGV